MTGISRWSRSSLKRGAISKWWGGALLAAGVAMTFGAASCGGSSGGGPFFFLGQGVWVADPFPVDSSGAETGVPQVDEFTTGQLNSRVSDVSPRKAITNPGDDTTTPPIPPFVFPQDTLFDANGNLWVVDSGTGEPGTAAIFEFDSSQLKNNGDVTPTFFLTSSDNFVFPQFAAFDAHQNLWVSDVGANEGGEIFEFTNEQLTTTPPGGDQEPALILQDSEDPFDSPLGIAFDSVGNLWVANNGDSDLLEFNADKLEGLTGVNDVAADGTIDSVSTDAGTDSVEAPWGLAFDLNGNLWVTNEFSAATVMTAARSAANGPQQAQAAPTEGQGTLVEFAAADVTTPSAGSTPTPAAVVLPTAVDGSFSILDPNGVTVDPARGLVIIANADSNDVEGFAGISAYKMSSIGSGGELTPNSYVPSTGRTTLGAPAGLIVGRVH